jgi:predicted GNAT family N-acyltransferase
MDALHAAARTHGLARVWCNAQISATPFYTKLGYRIVSERFDEAGIEHVRMERDLEA